ncbi:PAS domain-containing protein, partial [Mycobacterium tuberculosis]|nr:PAS domain-containing protein [Mycobacterium tuberculosis]
AKLLTVWHVADVTDDRNEQETSFQELQQVVTFLDHAPAGFFSADADGRIVYLNATLADWLGHDLARFEPGTLRLRDIVQGQGALLLDEPAAGVPSTDTPRIEAALERLPADLAVLMIEHDMDLVFRFARHVAVLAAGEVIFSGPPEAVAEDARVRTAYLGSYADARRSA